MSLLSKYDLSFPLSLFRTRYDKCQIPINFRLFCVSSSSLSAVTIKNRPLIPRMSLVANSILRLIIIALSRSTRDQRLRAAYGDGGTGVAVRGNWGAALLWKINRAVTRRVPRLHVKITHVRPTMGARYTFFSGGSPFLPPGQGIHPLVL